jgi:hypothetical protein
MNVPIAAPATRIVSHAEPGLKGLAVGAACRTAVRTMEAADILYGVTMQPGGSSKVVSESATELSGT